MTKLTMRSATDGNAVVPISMTHGSAVVCTPGQTSMAALPTGDTVESIRSEIADAQTDAESFYNREPDEVFRLVSGHHARLSTLRTLVGRFDAHPTWRRVKAELEETMDSLREQFNYHSRIVATRDLDYRIETGGRQV